MNNKQVFAGSQFVFIKPENKETVEVEITKTRDRKSESPNTLICAEPTVISRYGQDLSIRDYETFRGTFFSCCYRMKVVTDRKLYRKKDNVHFFVFSPHFCGKLVKINVIKGGHTVHSRMITLSNKGTYHDTFQDLEEGAYSVLAEVDESSTDAAFTVAEYTLSFLRTSFLSYANNNGTMDFEILAMTNDVPYTGILKVGLFCEYCSRVVEDVEIEANQGRARGSLVLYGHSGSFHLVTTTSEGDTSTLVVPGTGMFSQTGRDITLSEMGAKVTGGLMPGKSTERRERGIYISREVSVPGFITLETIIGERLTATVNVDLEHLLLCFFTPSCGTFSQIERRGVKEGETIEFEVPYPFAILTAGGMGKVCHETYSWLIHPSAMELSIVAPEKADPGSEVEIAITSRRKGTMMLIVADSRIEREDPFEKIAASDFLHMQKSSGNLHSGRIREVLPEQTLNYPAVSTPLPPARRSFFQRIVSAIFRNNRDSAPGLDAMPGKQMAISSSDFLQRSGKPESVVQLMASPRPSGRGALYEPFGVSTPADLMHEWTGTFKSRLSFPEMLLVELVDFEGELKRKVTLGDQIGAFNVYAFLIDREDYGTAKATIQSSKEVYVELDIPAILSPGDEIYGKVMARCPEKGTVSARSAITSIEAEIDCVKTLEIPLISAGEVMAEINSSAGRDLTSRVISRPGKESVTVSELRWLKPGESIEGERIAVYPNPACLVESAVSSLVQYPFGCAEQTSSKLYGLTQVYRAMDKGIIRNSIGQVDLLINQGMERMHRFFREGLFSLWEGGRPDLPTTVMVLRNLAPLRGLNNEAFKYAFINTAVDSLRQKRVRDNLLLPYSGEFSAPMKSVRDAAMLYRAGIQKGEAFRLIRKSAVVEEQSARWHDSRCWAGDTEATCHALQVLAPQGEQEMVEKGFRYLSTRLINSMLFSTSDTCAFLELLSVLPWKSSPRAILDGKEATVTGTVICQSVKAIDRMLVCMDSRKEMDYLAPCSRFKGEMKVDRASLSMGEKGVLEITPQESSIAPVVRIYLPGNIALAISGANVQKLYLPIKNRSLRLEFYGIRKGKGKIQAALHDMYDAEKTGVLEGINIAVTG